MKVTGRNFLFKGDSAMKIITISREFGSGGRELGKRLADALRFPCYDHEIIEMVAQKSGLDENYVAHISEKDIRMFLSYNHRSPPDLTPSGDATARLCRGDRAGAAEKSGK